MDCGIGIERHFRLQVLEDGSQTFQLPGVLGKEAKRVFLIFPGFEILYQEVELPVEGGLGAGVEFQQKRCGVGGACGWAELNQVEARQLVFDLGSRDKFIGVTISFSILSSSSSSASAANSPARPLGGSCGQYPCRIRSCGDTIPALLPG